MNPLLKTPPGRTSKFSSSMARSMRALILVTLDTSSNESSFFSRALRNLSPNSPTAVAPKSFLLPVSIIGQAGSTRHSQESKNGVTCGGRAGAMMQLPGISFTREVQPSRFFAKGQGELGFAGLGG